jgi:hypothetical protein
MPPGTALKEDFVSGRSWRAIHPYDAASLLAAVSAPWWIAGGWALDLFRAAPARPHVDLDVGVLRCDVLSLLEALSTWQVFEAKDGQLTGLLSGCVPRRDVHSLWCRPTAAEPWTIELMLDEGDREVWIYRRERSIRRSMSEVVRKTADRLPYLAPEIQLLYKSKAPRARDEVDFAAIWPLLDSDARSWLHDAITRVNPYHQWLPLLR